MTAAFLDSGFNFDLVAVPVCVAVFLLVAWRTSRPADHGPFFLIDTSPRHPEDVLASLGLPDGRYDPLAFLDLNGGEDEPILTWHGVEIVPDEDHWPRQAVLDTLLDIDMLGVGVPE